MMRLAASTKGDYLVKKFFALTVALSLVACVAPAYAQMVCDNYAEIIEVMEKKYGEVRRSSGVAGSTIMFEVWASEETGSWTIIKKSTNGRGCIMAVGQGWQQDTIPVPGSDT